MNNTPTIKQQIEELLISVSNVREKYYNKRKEDRFNIFYALHKEHDEVNLHSRFISYLLADDSGHLKKKLFAELFFKIVLKKDKNFLNEYEVIPNEFNKTEFKEIDILLFNKKLSHAIIIENKIFAKDSNHINKNEVEEGYVGQLERYYNTILKGVPNEIKPHNYISKKIDVFYLTLNKPKLDTFEISKRNIPESVGVKEIYYKDEIVNWLDDCLATTKDDDFLNKIINQYLILVKNMTKTNIPVKELKELRDIYSRDLKTTRYIIDNFKDIKWHTVNDFLIILAEELEKASRYDKVSVYPEDTDERAKLIVELTHYNKDVNIGVTFTTKEGKKLYISTSNNLSWGIVDTTKWKDFEDGQLVNIRFSDFSTENTYKLIGKKNTKGVIKSIIDEISTEINNGFENMEKN